MQGATTEVPALLSGVAAVPRLPPTAAGMRGAPPHNKLPCRAGGRPAEGGNADSSVAGAEHDVSAGSWQKGGSGKGGRRAGCRLRRWRRGGAVPRGCPGRAERSPPACAGEGCGGVTVGVTVTRRRPSLSLPSQPGGGAERPRCAVRWGEVRAAPSPSRALRGMPAAAPPPLHPAAGSGCPYGHCAGECPLPSMPPRPPSRGRVAPAPHHRAPLPGRSPVGGRGRGVGVCVSFREEGHELGAGGWGAETSSPAPRVSVGLRWAGRGGGELSVAFGLETGAWEGHSLAVGSKRGKKGFKEGGSGGWGVKLGRLFYRAPSITRIFD